MRSSTSGPSTSSSGAAESSGNSGGGSLGALGQVLPLFWDAALNRLLRSASVTARMTAMRLAVPNNLRISTSSHGPSTRATLAAVFEICGTQLSLWATLRAAEDAYAGSVPSSSESRRSGMEVPPQLDPVRACIQLLPSPLSTPIHPACLPPFLGNASK